MVEHVKRWAVLIAVAAMVWVGWAGMRQDVGKKIDRESMPSIVPADMPVRDASETTPKLGDPCKLDARGPNPPTPTTRRDSAVGVAAVRAAESAHVLTLDSILVGPEGGQALISGQTIAVGSTISGIDAEEPPILAWVDGVRAGVSYRGRDYVIDLDRDRRLKLDASPIAFRPTEASAKPSAESPKPATADELPHVEAGP